MTVVTMREKYLLVSAGSAPSQRHGPTEVTVEHVTVNAGGQAVVGNVEK
jgi:hypothetical protein